MNMTCNVLIIRATDMIHTIHIMVTIHDSAPTVVMSLHRCDHPSMVGSGFKRNMAKIV